VPQCGVLIMGGTLAVIGCEAASTGVHDCAWAPQGGGEGGY